MDRVGNCFYQQVDSCLMVGAILLVVVGFTSGHFVHDERITDNYPFNHSLGYDRFRIPIEQLVFYRRTAAIECHNYHDVFLQINRDLVIISIKMEQPY